MAYNNTDREYIFTNDYVAFRVKQEYLDKLLPDYLYMFFCRDEFDRYARYKSTGSATEFFNWEDMCAVPFEIPPMDFQQLVVNAYKVLNERIEGKCGHPTGIWLGTFHCQEPRFTDEGKIDVSSHQGLGSIFTISLSYGCSRKAECGTNSV